jgi:AcrR family transcriptional regulator
VDGERLVVAARSEEQRGIRRRAILDTTAAMLEEMPIGEISLNELSRRVGSAKSNVLRYFESREAILLELLDRAWRQWVADLPALVHAGIDQDAPAMLATYEADPSLTAFKPDFATALREMPATLTAGTIARASA